MNRVLEEKAEPSQEPEDAAASRRSRLQPVKPRELAPWHRSHAVTTCNLYWMPTSGPPAPFRQRQWLLQFFKLLREEMAARNSAENYLFLQMKVLYPDLMDSFLRNAPRFSPLLGLSRRPGAALPKLPDEEYADKLQKGKIKYDHKAIQPDYCYWFLKPETEEQTSLYFGMGGMMMMFAAPEEDEKIPVPVVSQAVMEHPAFRHLLAGNRVQKMAESMQKLRSPFFPKTKTVFGRGLEEELQFPGLKFIVPLLTVKDFTDATPATVEEWFTVFDVLLTESPTDKGLVLASRLDLDLDSLLIDLVEKMKDGGAIYPEFG